MQSNPKNNKETKRTETNTNIIAHNMLFEDKLSQLKQTIQYMKVDWRDAHEEMQLTRDNLLKASMKQFDNIDPYKVEIHFNS
jgi:hypothetical protein